jgi:hypothetical protein
MPTETMTFSKFLRESGSAVNAAERGSVLLERRDGADLLLKLAEREASEKEGMKFTIDLLAGALASMPENQTPDLPIHLMVQTFPWMEFLPEEDRVEFTSEFMRTLKGSDEIDRLDLVGTLVRQWKNTAEIWADPELRRRFAAPELGGEEIPHP